MKSNIIYPCLAALCLTALTAGGCNSKETEPNLSSSTVSASQENAPSSAATPTADPSTLGEGTAPTDLPEDHTGVSKPLNDPCEFTKDGQPLYTVTISDISFTERRAIVETKEVEKVLLITYTYQSLTEDPALVDDMSFRCVINDDETPSPYFLADQLVPELADQEHTVTAEIAYSVPADTAKADIYLVNNANPDGEHFIISVDLS